MFLANQQNAGKSTLYKCGNNIASISRWPNGGVPVRQVIDTVIDVIDMTATFMDVSGAQPVEGMHLDGMSILPVWKGKTDVLKPAIYTESGYAKGVVSKDWKYIAIRYNDEILQRGFNPNLSGPLKENMEAGNFELLWKKTPFGQDTKKIGWADPDQLFDLTKDPEEQNNLAGNPEYKSLMEKFARQLPSEEAPQVTSGRELYNVADADDPQRNINAYKRDVKKYKEPGLQPPLD